MVKKSILKRLSYISSAVVLMLATVPILPSGSAWADGGSSTCAVNVDNPVATLDGCGYSGLDAIFERINNDVGNGTQHVITLQQDTTAGGYKIKSLANFVFDLNGHTLTMGTTLVGSTGTESQDWQLLKNSNIEFRNGKIIAASSAQILIQNYANLTLRNVELDGTLMGAGAYTLSNNNGLVQILGNTSIKAKNGNYAFDACWAPNYYPDGAQIIVDTTGTITGGVQVDWWGTSSSAVRTSLTVRNGNFVGPIEIEDGLESVLEIEGGKFTAGTGLAYVEEGKVAYKVGNSYVVGEAPDMSGISGRMFAKVGEATTVDGLTDEILEYSTVTVSRLGTFADGKITATGVGTFDVKVKPEIYKKDDSGATVRDTSYDKKIKVHSYDFDNVNVVLPVGDDETLADDTVKVDETYDEYEYSVADENIATIDEDGKIVAVSAGETDVYATVKIKSIPAENVRVKIGTAYVYDFDSIEDTYLVKKGGKAKILADNTWDLTATTTAQNVSITKSGNNFKINGLGAGLANVDFAATIGGEDVAKSTKVYVYEVNGQDVVVHKGETVSDDEIAQLINKGHDDVAMRVKSIADESKVSNDDGWALTGLDAGGTTVRYRLAVGANDAHANVDLNVHVWDFVTENLLGVYDLGDLQTTTDAFKVYDNGGEISYTVKDESGAEVNDVVVNLSGDEYTITKADGARAGEYLVKFTDTVMGEEVASKTIAVRVHEIEIPGETERYVAMSHGMFANNSIDLGSVREKNHYSRTRDLRYSVNGTSLNGVMVNSYFGGFRANALRAGSYTVTFTDGIASASVDIYVIDFTVTNAEYHVKKGDTALHLVTALNEYWEQTSGEGTTDVTVWRREGTNGKYAIQLNENTEAGDYEVKFHAYVNGVVRDTKTVRVHVYEMVTPSYDTRYIETGDTIEIPVSDKNNRARISARVVEGDASGLSFARNGGGMFASTDYTRISARKPGVYTVRYTDYMGDGTKVGTYDVRIVVIDVVEETLLVRKGESIEITGNGTYAPSVATDWDSGVNYTAEENEDGEMVIRFDTADAELGEHTVYVAHDFAEYDDSGRPPREDIKIATVVVYEIESDDRSDPNDVTATTIENYLDQLTEEGLADDLLESSFWRLWSLAGREDSRALFGGNQFEAFNTLRGLRDAINDGEKISTHVIVYEYTEEEVADWVEEDLIGLVEVSGVDGVKYYDISIYLTIGEGEDIEPIGLLHQLGEKITIKVAKVEAPADGYTRQYTVAVKHAGEDARLLEEGEDFFVKDGWLYVKANKFSNYAVAYTDTLIPMNYTVTYTVTAPNTGTKTTAENSVADSMVVIITTILTTVTLAGAAVFAKRK